jgi:hypothetical protein
MKLPEIISMDMLLVEVMQFNRVEPLGQSETFVGLFPNGKPPIYNLKGCPLPAATRRLPK